MKNKIIGLVIAIVLIVIDLYTKQSITTAIPHNQRVAIIDNFFWLTHVHNTGAAWSLFNNSTSLLTIISVIASIVLVAIYLKNDHNRLTNIALVMMIAGTIGNLYDRAMLNYVRDFLSFNLFGYMFPVFNVADALLVIGVLLLVLEVFINERN